jgi:hypothetical protein
MGTNEKKHEPLSVIKLPEPSGELLKQWDSRDHPIGHCKASWQLLQIELLLNDLAFSAPAGFRMKLSFKAQHEGSPEILETMADYSRWLLKTTGSF